MAGVHHLDGIRIGIFNGILGMMDTLGRIGAGI